MVNEELKQKIENRDAPPQMPALEEMSFDELPDDLKASLYESIQYMWCIECDTYGLYEFVPGHNVRRDCRECGAEDVIQC